MLDFDLLLCYCENIVRSSERVNEVIDFMDRFLLQGRTAWITGASYGIGFAIARAFHAAGASIVFNDINRELVDKAWKPIRKRAFPPMALCAMLQTSNR